MKQIAVESLSREKRLLLELSDDQAAAVLQLAKVGAGRKLRKSRRFVIPKTAKEKFKSLRERAEMGMPLDEDDTKWVQYLSELEKAEDYTPPKGPIDEQALYRRLCEMAEGRNLPAGLCSAVLPNAMSYFRGQEMKPMIFAGPPGCGKTQSGEYIAEILGLPFSVISAPRAELGHSYQGEGKAFKGADIGEFARHMIRNGRIPGVFLIDELDKAASAIDNRVRQQDELLNIIADREVNDNFLEFSIPLAHCPIIIAVNDLESLDEPFRDRCVLVEFQEVELERMERIIGKYADSVVKKDYPDRVCLEKENLTEAVELLYEKGVTSIRKHRELVDMGLQHAYCRYLNQTGRKPVPAEREDFLQEARRLMAQSGHKSFGF